MSFMQTYGKYSFEHFNALEHLEMLEYIENFKIFIMIISIPIVQQATRILWSWVHWSIGSLAKDSLTPMIVSSGQGFTDADYIHWLGWPIITPVGWVFTESKTPTEESI